MENMEGLLDAHSFNKRNRVRSDCLNSIDPLIDLESDRYSSESSLKNSSRRVQNIDNRSGSGCVAFPVKADRETSSSPISVKSSVGMGDTSIQDISLSWDNMQCNTLVIANRDIESFLLIEDDFAPELILVLRNNSQEVKYKCYKTGISKTLSSHNTSTVSEAVGQDNGRESGVIGNSLHSKSAADRLPQKENQVPTGSQPIGECQSPIQSEKAISVGTRKKTNANRSREKPLKHGKKVSFEKGTSTHVPIDVEGSHVNTVSLSGSVEAKYACKQLSSGKHELHQKMHTGRSYTSALHSDSETNCDSDSIDGDTCIDTSEYGDTTDDEVMHEDSSHNGDSDGGGSEGYSEDSDRPGDSDDNGSDDDSDRGNPSRRPKYLRRSKRRSCHRDHSIDRSREKDRPDQDRSTRRAKHMQGHKSASRGLGKVIGQLQAMGLKPFRGDHSMDEDLNSWLKRMSWFCDLEKIHGKDRVHLIKMFVEDHALSWLERQLLKAKKRHETLTFSELKKKMLKTFSGRHTNYDIENKLYSMYQQAGESVSEYCSKVVRLARKLNYGDKAIGRVLQKGFLPIIRSELVKLRPIGTQNTMDCARNIEMSINILKGAKDGEVHSLKMDDFLDDESSYSDSSINDALRARINAIEMAQHRMESYQQKLLRVIEDLSVNRLSPSPGRGQHSCLYPHQYNTKQPAQGFNQHHQKQCFECHGFGHIARYCPSLVSSSSKWERNQYYPSTSPFYEDNNYWGIQQQHQACHGNNNIWDAAFSHQ